MRLHEALADHLSEEELAILPRGFDTVGDIAILEIPDRLLAKERVIAKRVLELHKHIHTAVAKETPHEGELRTRGVRYLAGEKKTETIHKESGVSLELDIEAVYFSPRLSHERLRIAQAVQPGERVLVMFSGCGPYPLVIAKNARPAEVIGVELNERGHAYALRNVTRNKAKNVQVLQGDVREVVPALGAFDRIAMPLPEGGEDFLGVALGASKHGSIIHFYDFLAEEEIPQVAFDKVDAACSMAQKDYRILSHAVCGQIGVRRYRVCVDFRII